MYFSVELVNVIIIIIVSSSAYNAVVTESVRSLLHYSMNIVYD